MSKIMIGQEITVTKNDKKRKGKVVYIHPRNRWFAVEFVGNYWNPFTGMLDRYRECFPINTNKTQTV